MRRSLPARATKKHKSPKTGLFVIVLLAFSSVSMAQRPCCSIDRNSKATPCPFNRSTYSFAGTPLEQARCLLRRVKIRGHLEPALAQLPAPLEDLIGNPVTITSADLARYLSTHRISPSDVGGRLNGPLSPADSSAPGKERARYFVIHDTSTPNYVAGFPSNINEESWSGNNLRRLNPNITHVYVNRLGQSRIVVDFGRLLPAGNFGTKFVCCLGSRRKGLFIHIELIQPRHCDSSNGACTPARLRSNIASETSNDNIAPEPGFTKPQLDRLALLYVAASVRKGEWLIPAFHASLDASLRSAHDDPQNFDLAEWARSVDTLVVELKSPVILKASRSRIQ